MENQNKIKNQQNKNNQISLSSIEERVLQNQEADQNQEFNIFQKCQKSEESKQEDQEDSMSEQIQTDGKKNHKFFWSPQEQQLLLQLYEQHGPSWSMMSSKFVNKSQNCIKNKFNSCARRAVKILDDHDRVVLRKLGRGINNKIVNIILEISTQARQMILRKNFSVNKQCSLFTFRSNFIKLCLKSESFKDGDLTNLSTLIKYLNKKLRCFGAFKRKYVKGWKLSFHNLKTICQFDKVCIQQQMLLQSQSNITKIDNEDDKINKQNLDCQPKKPKNLATKENEEQKNQQNLNQTEKNIPVKQQQIFHNPFEYFKYFRRENQQKLARKQSSFTPFVPCILIYPGGQRYNYMENRVERNLQVERNQPKINFKCSVTPNLRLFS